MYNIMIAKKCYFVYLCQGVNIWHFLVSPSVHMTFCISKILLKIACEPTFLEYK